MPVPKSEGGTAPRYMALQSLPVEIPWIPEAYATFDLIRCVDLTGAAYQDLMADIIAEEERTVALLGALPADAPPAARADLDAAYDRNETAGALRLLTATGCQVHGINPAPVPGQPATWAHLHPMLIRWLAYHARQEAGQQLQRPLSQLRARS